MGFVYPYFLFGLCAVAVPIVIHLFNFRKFKKVYFTNVKLLTDLQSESKKQSKVRDIILLCLRCLTICLLVLLFANPYIKDDKKVLVSDSGNAVLVFVDNSFSMENSSDKGSLLDVAKQKARDIAMQYSQSDVFCLMTQDMSGRHKHFVSRDRFLGMLSEVEISPSSLPMSKIVQSAHRFMASSTAKSKSCFYISDFQSSLFDAENFDKDSLNDVFVHLRAKNADNIFIDSVWFDNVFFKAGHSTELSVRIVNRSSEEAEKVPVKLFMDEQQITASSIDMQPNESRIVKMAFSVPQNGILHSKLSIADNPVCFDDDFYFTLLAREKVRVLAINQSQPNEYLLRLLSNDADVEFDNTTAGNIDFGQFALYSMIILHGLNEISSGLASELSSFVESAGSVCVIPSKDMDLSSVNNFLQSFSAPLYEPLVKKNTEVAAIDVENKLFKGVFTSVTDNMEMPKVQQYFPIVASAGSIAQNIMQFADKSGFATLSPQGKGVVYIFASALSPEWSNLVNQSVFVPLVWNMCTMSRRIPSIYYEMGNNPFIDLSAYIEMDNKEIYQVSDVSKTISFIPQIIRHNKQIGIRTEQQAKSAGNYNIYRKDSLLGGFSLNYPRKESILEFLSEGEIAKQLKANEIKNARVFSSRELIETQLLKSDVGFSFTPLLLCLIILAICAELILLQTTKKQKGQK